MMNWEGSLELLIPPKTGSFVTILMPSNSVLRRPMQLPKKTPLPVSWRIWNAAMLHLESALDRKSLQL